MTDAEISRRLALAIGWGASDIYLDALRFGCNIWADGQWRKFDYRDPAVIWPIAEHFDMFPMLIQPNVWRASWADEIADTAAKAVALAVIKAKEQT